MMSVNHSSFAAATLKSRSTRLPWTGGPGFRFRPASCHGNTPRRQDPWPAGRSSQVCPWRDRQQPGLESHSPAPNNWFCFFSSPFSADSAPTVPAVLNSLRSAKASQHFNVGPRARNPSRSGQRRLALTRHIDNNIVAELRPIRRGTDNILPRAQAG